MAKKLPIKNWKSIQKGKLTIPKSARRLIAKYDEIKDFRIDPKGYFLVKVNKIKKKIDVAFVKRLNKAHTVITGSTPMEICNTVIKKKLTLNPLHLSYLSKEVEKAKIALKFGIDYIQDNDLKLRKRK